MKRIAMFFHRVLRTLRDDLASHSMRGRLMRSAAATTMIKVVSTGIALLASLLFARGLGPHDYGLYASVLALVAVLSIPTMLGFPQYLIREGAKHPEQSAELRAWGDHRVALSGILAAIVLIAVALVPQASPARWLFLAACPLPALNAFAAVRQALLQATGQVARSQWAQQVFMPGIILIIAGVIWWSHSKLSPLVLVIVTTCAAFIPIVVNAYQLRLATPHLNATPLRSRPRVRAALPFMWLGGMYLLVSRTDLIMLGAIRGAHDAGIYSVASRAAELLALVGMAATKVAAPQFAKFHNEGKQEKLQQLLSSMVRRIILLTLPAAILLALFAHPLLGLVYGDAYIQGAHVLQILALAQLVAVTCGPLGTLLNMSGYERLHLLGIGSGALSNIVLNVLFIPLYGALGAAAATCASIVLSRIVLLAAVRRKLQLHPTALGF